MGRRRKRKIVHDVLMTGIADKGQAVGRDASGMVYFVQGAVPGDVVDIWVKKKKKTFYQGVVEEYKTLSEERVEAFCEHFNECGGCKWQNLDYASQLKFKNDAVLDAFRRIGHLEIKEARPILGCERTQTYRNKMEYSFSSRRWVPQEELDRGEEVNFGPATGFHKAGAFNMVVQIEKCFLQDDFSNKLRNFVHKMALDQEWSFYNPREHVGFLRNLMVRNTTLGEWMVVMIFGEEDKEAIQYFMDQVNGEFPDLTSVYYVINTKFNDSTSDLDFRHYKGETKITEQLGHIKYKIGPKSFFQTNTYQAKVLYDQIVELADLKGDELVYDLYTGLGSIALYVADKCKKVVGIEEIAPAIDDANYNKELNGITNADFEVGDCKEVFNLDFVDKYGNPDLVIVDPPRMGLHKDVVTMLGNTGVDKIVYVSCNPSTQARDIALLHDNYTVELIQPVDMFPHTHHIENIAVLKKR